MTNRDFFAAVVSMMNVLNTEAADDKEREIVAEVRAHAEKAIAKLDETNEKRRNTVSKKSSENEPIKAAIIGWMNAENVEIVTATEVGEKMGISTQKASALLRQMVEDGRMTSEEVKIPKKGKQKGYKVRKEG